MLDKDLTIEKMKAGISKVRNSVIAKIFTYMNMVEAWGTGIPKIFEEAKEYGLREPELEDMGSDFRIHLYRKEPVIDFYGVVGPKLTVKEAGADDMNFGTKAGTDGTKAGTDGTNDMNFGTDGIILGKGMTDEEKLLSVIREDGTITQKEMSQKTGLSLRTVKRMTVELQKAGKIVRIGNSRLGEWEIMIKQKDSKKDLENRNR